MTIQQASNILHLDVKTLRGKTYRHKFYKQTNKLFIDDEDVYAWRDRIVNDYRTTQIAKAIITKLLKLGFSYTHIGRILGIPYQCVNNYNTNKRHVGAMVANRICRNFNKFKEAIND